MFQELKLEEDRTIKIRIPKLADVSGTLGKTYFERVLKDAHIEELTISRFSEGRLSGVLGTNSNGRRFLFVPKKTSIRPDVDEVLVAEAASDFEQFARDSLDVEATRISPAVLNPRRDRDEIAALAKSAHTTWSGDVELRAEVKDGGRIATAGFRPPQIGALHALEAHWTVSDQVATVVMPTGTGKTDTMIAAALTSSAERLLVIVPSDVLRTQIASAFQKLGMLKGSRVVPAETENPIVALIRGRLETADQVDAVFDQANVVVTTMASASGAPEEVQARMAERSSHLFVDEAHHIAAKTWRAFRSHFDRSRVVQFTATPFRNDGLRVDGKFIFSYPLRLAQEAGYFRAIRFQSVTAFDQEGLDSLIAEKVVATLQEDVRAGFDHLAMARCRNQKRADRVFQLYAQRWPEARPVLLHSGLSADERNSAMRRLKEGDARLVVCVDMLGEGFDLPRLKIAGLHDPKKSEAPTLQFIGRFTRSGDELGDATVIAGTLPDTGSFLSRLYAEDADWNHLVSKVGALRTEEAIRREEVFQGFDDIEPRFPLETLRPRMSTIAFKTSGNPWNPSGISDFDTAGEIVDGPFINKSKALAIFVMRRREKPKWTTARAGFDTTFDLVMLYWNQETQLLYVHSTSGERVDELAACVCGDDVERIRGETVFRAMAGLKRPVLNVLGLSETRRRRIRHTQLQGTDIAQEVKPAPGNRTRAKTNLFVIGFDEHGRTTVGCSQKGKVWSYQATNDFAAWADWCDGIGAKLLNSSLSSDELMETFIAPKLIQGLPREKVPLAIILNDEILGAVEEQWTFGVDGEETSLLNTGIELLRNDFEQGLVFSLIIGTNAIECRMTISERGCLFEQLSKQAVTVTRGARTFSLAEWLQIYPPTVHFADGDSMIGDELLALPEGGIAGDFPSENLEVWDWDGVDITKEAHKGGAVGATVQGHVIAEAIKRQDARIVFNDDGAGESADVVVMSESENVLFVEFFHCKYSKSSKPGNRINDLYEVCGQAQQSIRWCEHPKRLLEHLLKREIQRQKRGARSGFEKGTMNDLKDFLSRQHELGKSYRVNVVQPGYSKAGLKKEHMQPLSATRALLMDTFGAPFIVVCSP